MRGPPPAQPVRLRYFESKTSRKRDSVDICNWKIQFWNQVPEFLQVNWSPWRGATLLQSRFAPPPGGGFDLEKFCHLAPK